MWFSLIAGVGNGLVVASILIPFLIGIRGGKLSSAAGWSWILFFSGCLYFDILGPWIAYAIWGSEAAGAIAPDQPGTLPALLVGWVPGLVFCGIGYAFRKLFRFPSGLRKS